MSCVEIMITKIMRGAKKRHARTHALVHTHARTHANVYIHRDVQQACIYIIHIYICGRVTVCMCIVQ